MMSGLPIDLPEVKAEVEAAFAVYEAALVANDVATLDRLFLDAPTTIRYGGGENLYGYAEIQAFRAGRPAAGLARQLERTVVTTYGRDFATASTLFRRDGAPGKVGRQMQTWVRMPEGWRVVAAHVSVIADPLAQAPAQVSDPVDERLSAGSHSGATSLPSDAIVRAESAPGGDGA